MVGKKSRNDSLDNWNRINDCFSTQRIRDGLNGFPEDDNWGGKMKKKNRKIPDMILWIIAIGVGIRAIIISLN